MTRVDLRIERVVLDGIEVAPRHVAALTAALEAELTRLVTEAPSGTWQQSRRERRVRTPVLTLPRTGPAAVGRQIARAVHDGLAGAGSRDRGARG